MPLFDFDFHLSTIPLLVPRLSPRQVVADPPMSAQLRPLALRSKENQPVYY